MAFFIEVRAQDSLRIIGVKMPIGLVWLFACVEAFEPYQIPRSRDPPSPRQLLRIAHDSVKNTLVLFSGSGVGNVYFDDLWEFDVGNYEWANEKPSSLDVPQPRINYGWFFDSSTASVYLFGGEGKYGYLNDLWRFDVKQLSWVQKTALGDTPLPCSRFAQTTYSDASGKLKYLITNAKGLFTIENDVFR